MSELAIFIIGVSVFTVTVMAVLWAGYLVMADRFDADRSNGTQEAFERRVTLIDVRSSERSDQPDRTDRAA